MFCLSISIPYLLPPCFIPALCALYLNLTTNMQGKWYLSISRMKKNRHKEIICPRSTANKSGFSLITKSRQLPYMLSLLSLIVLSLDLSDVIYCRGVCREGGEGSVHFPKTCFRSTFYCLLVRWLYL